MDRITQLLGESVSNEVIDEVPPPPPTLLPLSPPSGAHPPLCCRRPKGGPLWFRARRACRVPGPSAQAAGLGVTNASFPAEVRPLRVKAGFCASGTGFGRVGACRRPPFCARDAPNKTPVWARRRVPRAGPLCLGSSVSGVGVVITDTVRTRSGASARAACRAPHPSRPSPQGPPGEGSARATRGGAVCAPPGGVGGGVRGASPAPQRLPRAAWGARAPPCASRTWPSPRKLSLAQTLAQTRKLGLTVNSCVATLTVASRSWPSPRISR